MKFPYACIIHFEAFYNFEINYLWVLNVYMTNTDKFSS